MPFDGSDYQRRAVASEKIDRVIDRKDRWCKKELRSRDGRRCIVGALEAVGGAGELKLPIFAL